VALEVRGLDRGAAQEPRAQLVDHRLVGPARALVGGGRRRRWRRGDGGGGGRVAVALVGVGVGVVIRQLTGGGAALELGGQRGRDQRAGERGQLVGELGDGAVERRVGIVVGHAGVPNSVAWVERVIVTSTKPPISPTPAGRMTVFQSSVRPASSAALRLLGPWTSTRARRPTWAANTSAEMRSCVATISASRRCLTSSGTSSLQLARGVGDAAVAVAEHEGAVEADLAHQREGVLVVGLGLAAEADHEVGAESARPGMAARSLRDQRQELGAGVAALHGLEHGVGAGLGRQVHVGADLRLGGHDGDQLVGEVDRVGAGEADRARCRRPGPARAAGRRRTRPPRRRS
jgi:hypothetical protein